MAGVSTASLVVAEASSVPQMDCNLFVHSSRTRVSCPAFGYRGVRVSVFSSLGSHGHSARGLMRNAQWLGRGGSVTHLLPWDGAPQDPAQLHPMTSGRTHVTGEAGGRWGQGDKAGGVPVLVDSAEGRGELSTDRPQPGALMNDFLFGESGRFHF